MEELTKLVLKMSEIEIIEILFNEIKEMQKSIEIHGELIDRLERKVYEYDKE